MMSIIDLPKKTLAAVLPAFVASAMLPACSSTDEAAQPEDTGSTGGGSGLPCDIDPGQPECLN
jgi:hypothetical protein